MGNICRSPTAHGVFRHRVTEAGLEQLIEVDSAGTHAYHVGEPPDRRARLTASRRGIELDDLRARRVIEQDFEHFDHVLAMDRDNLEILLDLCPLQHRHKVRLFMDLAPEWGVSEVPDPYYGGDSGFERVFDMVEAASQALLDEIKGRI